MKKLFQNKGSVMLKCLINQFAMSLFGIMMATTAVTIGNGWLLPFGLFSLLFYFFILLTFLREDGFKDALRIRRGSEKRDLLLPVKYCGIAALPGFIIALAHMVIALLCGLESPAVGILNIVTRVMAYGMYTALDVYLFSPQTGVLSSCSFLSDMGISFVIYTFVTLLFCFFAYHSGAAGANADAEKQKKE